MYKITFDKGINIMNLSKSESTLLGTFFILLGILIGYHAIVSEQVDSNFTYTNEITSTQSNNDNISENTAIPDENVLVNINTATVEELSKNLYGIGQNLADRIVEYRNTHGGFHHKEELKEIKGISDKKYDDIKDYIIVK